MKYAHVERERRFLLFDLPREAQGVASKLISDRYIAGTGLRLRVVEEPPGPAVRKLGQKIRLDKSSPPAVAHTTMYLSEADFAVLVCLPAAELTKSRHILDAVGVPVAVDVFYGQLSGLVLAEVDLGETGGLPATLPFSPVAEVTDDERFTGGQLALTDTAHLRRLLDEFSPHH